jgi:hypothetical protein
MNTSDVVLTPSPRVAAKALGTDDLRRIAPSVFAETARPGVSSRYTFVSTAQVVDLLRGEGWEPVKANQQRVRLADRQGFQTHEIRFARRDDLDRDQFAVGDCRPELILQNAHDGTRAYRIDAGLYRLVCRNGLVVADADFAHVAIRHVDVSADKFASAAQAVAEGTPRVLEVIARWRAVQLTGLVRHNFAARAAALRWDADQPVTRLLNPDQLLAPVRYGDRETDLWTTFNVVQERLCRGGLRYAGHIPAAPDVVFPTHYLSNTTRPVGGLTQGQQLNKALWALAEEFSRN